MCRRFTTEMPEWAGGAETSWNPHGNGTIAWVCVAVETEEAPPCNLKES
jgi:hypothetical protein